MPIVQCTMIVQKTKNYSTSNVVSTTVDSCSSFPDHVTVQPLQNNASVKAIHDGDIKDTSNKDSALTNETCEVVQKTGGVSDIAGDGLIHGADFGVTQGVIIIIIV